MKETTLKSKKPGFSFMNKEVSQIKALNGKFFSLSLMWEGIKQTKTLGICFVIFTVLASCCIPFLKIINFASMSAEFASQQPIEDVSLLKFSFPILTFWIIFPIILVIALFKFMNDRASSDFYHSISLGRTCIYISYSVSVFLWGVAAILISTVLSYVFYLIAPHYIMIPVSFMGVTILASIIAMFLSMSATLLAKGLSGTGFSNVVIAILIMYAPRIIILIFAQSVINAVQVATITSIGFVNPTLNILLTPIFATETGNNPITEPSTLWYSLILGIVYYILGLIAHKFRKSETAGKSSSYKGVQHVVRSAFGFVPLLVICYALATRWKLSSAEWVMYIGISVIMYLLYELATTRNWKKLLISIPLYLIVLVFSVIFVWGSLTISNSIIDDIPEVSDIESVSITNLDDYNIISRESYYSVKYADYKFTDEELIKILQESLVDNVNSVKRDGRLDYYNGNFEIYTVIFHTKSNRDLDRKIVVNTEKYFNDSDIGGVAEYICEDEKYSEIFTQLPSNNEIMSMSFSSEYISIEQIAAEKVDMIWNTFTAEFADMSKEEKISLLFGDYYQDGNDIGVLSVSGYVEDDYFNSRFNINSSLTPKTYSKIVDISNDGNRENFKENIIDTITKDTDISIWSGYINRYFETERGGMVFSLECEPEANKALATGYFDELKKYYDFNFDSTKNIDKIKEILNIIYESSKNEFNINDTYPLDFSIYYPFYNKEYDYTNYEYIDIFANLSTEQYDRIAKIFEELEKDGIQHQ